MLRLSEGRCFDWEPTIISRRRGSGYIRGLWLDKGLKHSSHERVREESFTQAWFVI